MTGDPLRMTPPPIDPTAPPLPRRTGSWATVPAKVLTSLDERAVARLERDCSRGYVDAVEARAIVASTNSMRSYPKVPRRYVSDTPCTVKER